MRKQPWELAAELLVVMLRRIEDSAGRLNLVNATNEVHLNTVMDEARANTEHFHGAAFFRTRAGNARIDETTDDDTTERTLDYACVTCDDPNHGQSKQQ